MPAKADSGDNWGLVDAKGEFLFEDEFSNRPSAVVNGYFYVQEGDGYSVYKAEKTPKPVNDLTGLKAVGFYKDGLIPVVRRNEPISFVDADGNTRFTLKDVDGVNVTGCANFFINGRCAICTADGRWGAIDTDGNVVIKPKYNNAMYFIEDYVVAIDEESGEASVLDKDGNVKAPISCNVVWGNSFNDGYSVGVTQESDDTEFLLIKENGEFTRLPSSVKNVRGWNDRYIIYNTDEGSCGIMTVEGEITVRAKYDDMELLANGKFMGERNGKYMYVNPDNGETEPIGKNASPAIKYPYIMNLIFGFDFEMVSENDDDEMQLRSYNGDKIGKPMYRYKGSVDVDYLYSDYYDYDAATQAVVDMFDDRGLKGYPFASSMGRYIDPERQLSWYNGDRSLGVDLHVDNPSFTVSSATLRSDNYIVKYAGFDYNTYTSIYEVNDRSRVDYFKVTLELGDNNHREDLIKHITTALSEKFGIEVYNEETRPSTLNEWERMCEVNAGSYGYIVISSGRKGWLQNNATVEEEIAVPADSAIAVIDTMTVM